MNTLYPISLYFILDPVDNILSADTEPYKEHSGSIHVKWPLILADFN
jgi:hypothetical protein